MKRLLALVTLLLAISWLTAEAEKKHTVVFEATVVRIDTWGFMKFTCGVAINYRLAEYKVDAVYRGHLAPGQRVVVKHLACNWNEINDLQPGDEVLVVAESLKHPEKSFWQPTFDRTATERTDTPKRDEITHVPLNSENVLAQFRALKVAKLIFPTSK